MVQARRGMQSYTTQAFRRLPIRHAASHHPCVTDLTPNERLSLANLLLASGRDPGSFQVTLRPDGLVRVSGPRGTAFYPRENWFSRFARHLDKSFFDPAPPPAAPRLVRAGAIAT